MKKEYRLVLLSVLNDKKEDDYNDIDMQTLFGTGICIGNGVQKVKDAVDVR